MSKQCQHPDLYVEEEYVNFTFHSFQQGEYVWSGGDESYGKYTGRLFVSCKDCGMQSKLFHRATAPKWLKERLDTAVAEATRKIRP